MKKSLRAVVTSSALLAYFPVHAADAPPARPTSPLNSEAFKTVTDAARELLPVADHRKNINAQLDRYAKFEFSEGLKPRLQAVFGTGYPMRLQRAPAPKGRNNYVAGLPAHS